jgi:pyruvate dehydrogenase E1 component
MARTKPSENSDVELLERREWLDSLDYVLQAEGTERAARILKDLRIHAERDGVRLPYTANTPYINTIPETREAPFPGSQELERRIKSLFPHTRALRPCMR